MRTILSQLRSPDLLAGFKGPTSKEGGEGKGERNVEFHLLLSNLTTDRNAQIFTSYGDRFYTNVKCMYTVENVSI